MELPVIHTKPAPDLEVPELFSRLRDLAYNLWWSWSPRAHLLFHRLAPSTWRHYRNPIDVLIDLGPERWESLQDDDDFTALYHEVIREFDAYVKPAGPTWFAREHGEYRGGPFAYFCTEFGWHECLQIYSGGLGVLSGDHCKSASDLGIPFVGIGLMYRHGYFRQSIDAEGFQQHVYPDYDLHRLPLLPVVDSDGRDLHVLVELPERSVHVRVWRALVGRVPVLLLDADLPINHPADRPITSTLYVRGREMRLCQEILLGMGGVLVLRSLGITPGAWHANEGHSALLAVERLADEGAPARPFDETLASVRESTIFTTHTPVPAGNEVFDSDLVRHYLGDWAGRRQLDLDRILALGRMAGAENSFNLTALALRTSKWINGVSELHGQVATTMWKPLLEPDGRTVVEYVTNGVHPPTWVGPEMGELLRRHGCCVLDERLLEPGFAERVEAIPDHELWAAHIAQKKRLISLLRDQALVQAARHGRSPRELREVQTLFNAEALTIGFARRFATYKRADLILRDLEQVRALLGNAERPVQIVFAGKAHPADRPGQDLIRRICQAALAPEMNGRVIFLENYDMRIGRHLVQGVDLWLNTPRRPHEASGTSGMKAAVNGVPSCSILDGWWAEGYDPSLGWAIGGAEVDPDETAQDRKDAEALYRLLREEIVPAYYERAEHGLPVQWIRRMKQTMARLIPRFSTARMVREYTEHFYLPAERAQAESRSPPAGVVRP